MLAPERQGGNHVERAAGSGGIGATVLDQTEAMEGLGRFGWIEDPEGNRVELWEPAPEALVPEIMPADA